MRRFSYLIISILLISLSFHSCKEPDLTAAYIHVTKEDLQDRIDVTNFNEMHGLDYDQEKLEALKRHKFTHVNIYVNNKNLGCWELPCKVPVLDVNSSDTSTLILLPAFPLTGMSNTISGYPFLNICRQKVILQKGTTYEVSQNLPTYIYSEYATFPFFETFSNSSSFTASDTSRSKLTFLPVSREGKYVGEIVLDDSAGLSFDVTSTQFETFIGSYRTVLEITYKTDCSVDVSMRMSTATNPRMAYSVGGFYASPDEWKTIHFELTNILNGNHNTSGNKTKVNLILSGVGDEGKVSHVAIDDIKVVYIRTA